MFLRLFGFNLDLSVVKVTHVYDSIRPSERMLIHRRLQVYSAPNFVQFSAKTLIIRTKVLGRKYSKRQLRTGLLATFSDVCLLKTELRANDIRIQVFCFGKATYLFLCVVEIHDMVIILGFSTSCSRFPKK